VLRPGHPKKRKAKAEEARDCSQEPWQFHHSQGVRYFDDMQKRARYREGIRQLCDPPVPADDSAGYRPKVGCVKNRHGSLSSTSRIPSVSRCRSPEIFGTLPCHVIYVPIDLETEDLTKKMERSGFSRTKKSLFMLEGLLMYIPPAAVDVLLGRIRQIAAPGSRIIFDYYPASVVYGSDRSAIAENIRNFCRSAGEPLLFGRPMTGL